MPVYRQERVAPGHCPPQLASQACQRALVSGGNLAEQKTSAAASKFRATIFAHRPTLVFFLLVLGTEANLGFYFREFLTKTISPSPWCLFVVPWLARKLSLSSAVLAWWCPPRYCRHVAARCLTQGALLTDSSVFRDVCRCEEVSYWRDITITWHPTDSKNEKKKDWLLLVARGGPQLGFRILSAVAPEDPRRAPGPPTPFLNRKAVLSRSVDPVGVSFHFPRSWSSQVGRKGFC